MKKIQYIWNKLLKKLPMSAIKNSSFEYPSRAEARSTVINTSFGKYSYCGYNCTLINCNIGRYCSISDNVLIGLGHHPIDWVSTSPAFYRGKDSIPKDIAKLDYDTQSLKTVIGNDVWIGANVLIKDGITIEDGAIIGMGSVVTKNVPAYSIVAGNPARVIRMRFSDQTIEKMLKIRWWDLDKKQIAKLAPFVDQPDKFFAKWEEIK